MIKLEHELPGVASIQQIDVPEAQHHSKSLEADNGVAEGEQELVKQSKASTYPGVPLMTLKGIFAPTVEYITEGFC